MATSADQSRVLDGAIGVFRSPHEKSRSTLSEQRPAQVLTAWADAVAGVLDAGPQYGHQQSCVWTRTKTIDSRLCLSASESTIATILGHK